MMVFARLNDERGQHKEAGAALAVGDVVAEIVADEPATLFTAEVAALFTPVDASVVYMARWDGAAWVAPPAPEPVEPAEPQAPAKRKRLSPVEFKMQFTPTERLAIRAARAYTGEDAAKKLIGDAIDDFFDLVDDVRLTMVDLAHNETIGGVNALATFGLIQPGRVAEILAGVDG